jgi:hypothetical protein
MPLPIRRILTPLRMQTRSHEREAVKLGSSDPSKRPMRSGEDESDAALDAAADWLSHSRPAESQWSERSRSGRSGRTPVFTQTLARARALRCDLCDLWNGEIGRLRFVSANIGKIRWHRGLKLFVTRMNRVASIDTVSPVVGRVSPSLRHKLSIASQSLAYARRLDCEPKRMPNVHAITSLAFGQTKTHLRNWLQRSERR